MQIVQVQSGFGLGFRGVGTLIRFLISLVEKHDDHQTHPVGDENAGDNFVDDVAVPQKTYKKNARRMKKLGRQDSYT